MAGRDFELRGYVHSSHCRAGIDRPIAVPIKQCYNWNESSDISGHITARSLNNDIYNNEKTQ